MNRRKRTILHVVGRMNRGGVETWLMHLLRNIDRQEYQMDFMVHSDVPGDYDDEIERNGSRVLPCCRPRKLIQYSRSFRRILREYGPYDVIHSHVHHFSGCILPLARASNVPIRIAHSHSDTTRLQLKASPARQVYLKCMKESIAVNSTLKLAASEKAAVALFGSRWKSRAQCRIVHCAIDLESFRRGVSRDRMRDELGIPSDALVLGHVGNFTAAKNVGLLIETMHVLVKQRPGTRLLLVGDGPVRPHIQARVSALNLDEQVTFLGKRADVPELMLGAMDVFVLPSLWEGLPLVSLEAQAAGLPVVMSDTVTQEAEVIPSLVGRVGVDEPPESWALAVNDMAFKRIAPEESTRLMEATSFSVPRCAETLAAIYRGPAIACSVGEVRSSPS